MFDFEYDFQLTPSGEFEDPTVGADDPTEVCCCYEPSTFTEPVDPGFYVDPWLGGIPELTPAAATFDEVATGTAFPSDPSTYFPVDDVVRGVLGQTAPVVGAVDGTVDWINEDPSRGWVGDAPWTDPQQGVLAPVLGDTGQLGQIIGGVLDDPKAPLDPGDAAWVGRETELNAYWNPVFGGVQSGIDVQQGAIDDLWRYNDKVALHNRISELDDLMNGIANVTNSWPNVDGGYGLTYSPYPWPNY